MQGLKDKHFIVTGAGSGIGAGTVQRLLAEGAKVTAADISEAGLAKTRAAANNAAPLHDVVFDLGREQSIKDLVTAATKQFGRLDGIANVAADVSTATMEKDVEVGQFDPALWAHVLNVNLIGSGILVRESLPHLEKAGGGSIVLISSAAAWMGDGLRPAYAASKIGLHTLARHTARAWGKKGVRCNVIAPGMVLTEASAVVVTQEYKDAMLQNMCAPVLGYPKDLGAAIAFLLSDDSSWITAQTWSVDGGLIMRE